MRGTPLSPPSTPKWASAGTYTTTHISRIKNLHMQYFGVLLAFPVTGISHYCNIVLGVFFLLFSKLHSFSVTGQWHVFEDMWGLSVYSNWCALLSCPVSVSCWRRVPKYLHVSMNLTHFFVAAEMWLSVVCVSQWWQEHHSDRPGFWSGTECHHAGGGNWTFSEYPNYFLIYFAWRFQSDSQMCGILGFTRK